VRRFRIHEVVDGGGKGHHPADAGEPSEACLPTPAHGLEPAKDLLDPFAFALAHPVARMARRPPIDRTRVPRGVVAGAFSPKRSH